MNITELKQLRSMWVSEDVDRSDFPENQIETTRRLESSLDEISLRMCYIDLACAGRYSMKFRNQGFDTNDFSSADGDDELQKSRLYGYISSTDVCYYDAEFKSESGLAYDVSLYAELVRDREGFNSLADSLDAFFTALKTEDLAGLQTALRGMNGSVDMKTGSVTADCFDPFGMVADVVIAPAD